MEVQPQAEGAVSAPQVLQVISSVLSVDTPIRSAAEALLRQWEADACPGFLYSLIQIIGEPIKIEEPLRLLAAVVAKNAVGSSWRKTLGSREWSRVPADEQAAVREGTMRLMLSDPSGRVAVQLGLLMANIARFDFPTRAPDLLEQLVQYAQWPSMADQPAPGHLRALKALRRVLAALTNKRFFVEPARMGQPGMSAGFMDLRAAASAIAQEREVFKTKLQQAAAPLTHLFLLHCQAFIMGAAQWDKHALAAKATATCLAERLYLTPQADALPDRAPDLLRSTHEACSAIMRGPPAGAVEPGAAAMWWDLGGRLYERMCRFVIGHLDTHPIAFAEYVAPFLQLFVGGALLATDASSVHRMRPKRRVLLVRFIAKALLSPYYRSEWTAAPAPPMLNPQQRAQLLTNRGKARQAQEALEALLGSSPLGAAAGPSSQCSQLIEAVISKYIALTPDEVQEWETDPEGYARGMEVECSPDADTPRPIGVGLLLCMLERGGEPVAQALLALAARLQTAQGAEAVLLREATYRCLGEGFSHVAPHISFQQWYESELQPMLIQGLPQFVSGQRQEGGVLPSILQARTLWLVGACGVELAVDSWGRAFQLLAAHMAATDLVVALTAVNACLAISAPLLDDQSILAQAEAAKRRAQGGDMGGASGLVAALHLSDTSQTQQLEDKLDSEDMDEDQMLLAITTHKIDTRVRGLANTAEPALKAAFELLGRLSEVEGMVKVLQLCSVMVEALGDRIAPQLPIIAAALPKVWEAASQHASSSSGALSGSFLGQAAKEVAKPGNKDKEKGNTAAVVRLHSALLAVLTHLVQKLKGLALADPQIGGVVYPLLDYATRGGSPESECLVDEAYRLWSCALSALPEVPPQLAALLPNLANIMRLGRDASQTLPLVEAYLLLGSAAQVIPLLGLIQQTMVGCIQAVEQAALAALQPAVPDAATSGPPLANGSGAQHRPTGGSGNGMARTFSGDVAAEAMATSALADVMLQLSPAEVPSLLAPTFRSMVRFVSHPALPVHAADTKLLNVYEGCLEVLGRVFLVQPSSFNTLMQEAAGVGPQGEAPHTADPQAVATQFLDRWLTVSGHVYAEEQLGVKTMAMLGRYRRRMTSAAICHLMAVGQPPAGLLDTPAHLARAAALAIQAVLDEGEFHQDQAELENLDFKGDLAEDRVLAKRLAITRADPVRTLKMVEAARGLLHGAATKLGGAEHLLALLGAHSSPRLVTRAAALMKGDLGTVFEGQEEELGLSADSIDEEDECDDFKAVSE